MERGRERHRERGKGRVGKEKGGENKREIVALTYVRAQ